VKYDGLAHEALAIFIKKHPDHVLDIGCGAGAAANVMRAHGIRVTTLDPVCEADIKGVFPFIEPDKKYDGIWCSHVLEHVMDVGVFLRCVRQFLRPNGYLAITVPPYKKNLVWGHINLFMKSTLVYNLILAGFDCSDAMVGRYGYNISVIVRNPEKPLPCFEQPPPLDQIAEYFPWKVSQNVDDDTLTSVNWFVEEPV
jgi:SAM-dependent methyltransferase